LVPAVGVPRESHSNSIIERLFMGRCRLYWTHVSNEKAGYLSNGVSGSRVPLDQGGPAGGGGGFVAGSLVISVISSNQNQKSPTFLRIMPSH
jgi:hypothetical protein